MYYKEILSYGFEASPFSTQILQSSVCKQHVLQICVGAPHLLSSPAEPPPLQSPLLQAEDPFLLPALTCRLTHRLTFLHLQSCPLHLSSLLPSFLPQLGLRRFGAGFGGAGSSLTAVTPQMELVLQQGSASPCANTEVHCDQQWLVRYRLCALLSSLLPNLVSPKAVPSMTEG